jgi:hypothetical protein
MISEDIEGAVPVQAGHRGWLIGHFVAPRAGPAATDMVEVKWGVHTAGAINAIEKVNQTATTTSLVVSGRFRLVFPEPRPQRDAGSRGTGPHGIATDRSIADSPARREEVRRKRSTPDPPCRGLYL